MSVFSAANSFHVPEPYNRSEAMSPSTPRPNTAPSVHQMPRIDDATTPTRANFGNLAKQKPLPSTASFPASAGVKVESEKLPIQRNDSSISSNSKRSHDVDMDDSDDGGDDGGSDDGSVNPDGTKSSKKKKGQKFYCTEYPPCTLSFTRSEHLARHIRKHTGERPFQCHCSRRFSRLDNLRQHAQTVHVNEDIPTDSLAASGTRFQRQVRSERARPMGNRSRASTVGSQSSGGRGHHRNSLSASSIGSVSSNYSQRDDPRRRPPPLPLASDPRAARLSVETYNFRPGSPSNQFYRPPSPGFGTPTSTTNSVAGQNSPRWTGMQSPSSGHSRTQSLFHGHRTPGRRLSVPSGANPFQAYMPVSYGSQLSPLNSSNSAAFPILPSNAPNPSMASPTSSTSGSSWSRRDSVASMVEGDWRRRTWHSDTHSNFTSSRLNVVTTPNQYQQQPQVYQYPPPPPPPPAFTLASQNTPPQTTRLPGIKSFDPFRPQTPTRRDGSPMVMDTPTRQSNSENYDQQPPQLDRSLNQNLSGLELVSVGRHPGHDSAHMWASEAERAVQEQAEQVRTSQPTVRFEQPIAYHQPTQYANVHPQHVSAPPITPRSAKRAGWYNGPLKSNNRSHGNPTAESSNPEGIPETSQSSHMSDYNPSVNPNGWVDSNQTIHHMHMQDPRTVQLQLPPQVSSSNFQNFSAPGAENYTYAHNGGPDNLANPNVTREGHAHKSNSDMDRLQTLVAVATGDNGATSAY